ncbi:MAG: hypothetical protein WC525_07500 [Candidatus Thermoplasmatota archaeon]
MKIILNGDSFKEISHLLYDGKRNYLAGVLSVDWFGETSIPTTFEIDCNETFGSALIDIMKDRTVPFDINT